MTRQVSFDDYRKTTGRGGPRPGAGRKAMPGARVLHRERGKVPSGCPAHVTLRMRRDVPPLRRPAFLRELRNTLRQGAERGSFRLVHYSVQSNHVHLLVEAKGAHALSCGMKSLGARIARAVNRSFARRGPVLDGRYHAHILRTPREVRAALAYVLLNARRHFAKRPGTPPPVRMDVASSSRWFDGWVARFSKDAVRARGGDTPEIARPRSWLLTQGWRRYGLIDLAEVPGLPGLRARGPAESLAMPDRG